MGDGGSLQYRLRQNKAVDRELFLSLLGRLAARLKLENYSYVGLGGPFLEDFRLVHARLGVRSMVCIESEFQVHLRQKFNRPLDNIECINSDLKDYVESTDFESPVIIWFDFTDPNIFEQVNLFADTFLSLPVGSVMRITLNANPQSLSQDGAGNDLLQARLDEFRRRFGSLAPSGLGLNDMQNKVYGRVLLKMLKLYISKQSISASDRIACWPLSTHYSDGQAMVTSTLIISDPAEEEVLQGAIDEWEFNSDPNDPLVLDLPALSSRERLSLEASANPEDELGFDLPKSKMKTDPIKSFKSFYRVFPHFSKVEL